MRALSWLGAVQAVPTDARDHRAAITANPRWRWRAALLGGLIAALGGGLVAAVLVPRALSAVPPATPLPAVASTPPDRQHVEIGTAIVYAGRPPSSGPHFARTLRYGVFEREVDPGYWVHTLEHGGIVVLYNCAEPCPTLVEELRRIYNAAPASERYHVVKMAVVPYRDMDHRVAAVAWGVVDEQDAMDGERILRFYREHVDRGPEEAL